MTAAWQVRFQSRTFVERSVFTTSGTCVIRPLLIEYPGLPVHPAHVSISFGFPEGVGFLGHLSRYGLRLVACSGGLESVKRVTLFRTSISRDVRTMLYAGFRYE